MALWQFHIYFIPQKSLLNKYAEIPDALVINQDAWSEYFENGELTKTPEFEDALSVHWWHEVEISSDILLEMMENFGPVQNWTKDADGLRSFGDPDKNDISVCFNAEKKQVEDVSCRIDLRKIDGEFIKNVLSLALQFDCMLMDKQGRLYPPTASALSEKIKLSNSYRFLGNPKQFLIDLSNGEVLPE